MFRRIFLAAIAAGLLAGAAISVVHSFTTTPIILHAEEFEGGGHHDAGLITPHAQHAHMSGGLLKFVHSGAEAHADTAGAGEPWAPDDGLERTFYSTLANLIAGVGFALLVVAGMALHGGTVTPTVGLLWGAAGFAVFTLAPALGLPPEAPGSMAADLQARQLWWCFAVAGAGAGLGLLVFAPNYLLKALGVAVAVIPHLVGAPQPESIGGAVPPELAGHFAATSIIVSAIFWVLIGTLSAAFYRRIS
ncbi:CbtA family protein [Rhodovibrio salinarum]|uniref:Cobalt transporter subunit CbtA n=1 Tax=Rhodovibrio salinarum TaxID=1087 RepID=A0A934QJV4_9PROT|nr:CbtA family protein [Rhodovibrio salinarum]MBK1698206.1 hypothetical protein [Rhodovibrio salinarum]